MVRQQTGAGCRRIIWARPVAGGREVGVEGPDPGVDVAHERQIPPQDRSYDRNVDLVHVTSVLLSLPYPPKPQSRERVSCQFHGL